MSIAGETPALRRAALAAVGGESVAVPGGTALAVFDYAYGEALGAAGRVPVLTLVEEDAAGIAVGATVTVRGSAYRVQTVEPDGTGIVVLTLHKAA